MLAANEGALPDTCEQITDDHGELQYIPFPTCEETGRPLELVFGSENGV